MLSADAYFAFPTLSTDTPHLPRVSVTLIFRSRTGPALSSVSSIGTLTEQLSVRRQRTQTRPGQDSKSAKIINVDPKKGSPTPEALPTHALSKLHREETIQTRPNHKPQQ